MKNYLIFFRDEENNITQKIYVRATTYHFIISAAKKYLGITEQCYFDFMDYGQSKKTGIPFISI